MTSSTSKSESRAKTYYHQCKRAYEGFVDSGSVHGFTWDMGDVSIGSPNDFYDLYHVPAELLYRELNSKNTDTNDNRRLKFYKALLRMVSGHEVFDINNLKLTATKNETLNRFHVYFELYFYKDSLDDPDLFVRSMSFRGVSFQWVSLRTFKGVVKKHDSSVYSPAYSYRSSLGRVFPGQAIESRMHPLRATVEAVDMDDAVDRVERSIMAYIDCVNVVERFGQRSVSFVGEGAKKAKSSIVSTGVFIASGESSDLRLYSVGSKRYDLPTQPLKLTGKERKIVMLKSLIKVFNYESSAISERIKFVVSEFALALDASNPNIRLLSFWRCLEIATKMNGQDRKHRDIIKIFENYYPKCQHWKQQGELILDARNVYVHQGVASKGGNDIGDKYLNWAQQYAEVALNVLLYIYKNRKIWSTSEDIDTFFNSYAMSNRELELGAKLLNRRSRATKEKLS